ncbi:MAG: hypothetical protein GY806_11185 [Gammaproteobacteria bacterium]|nr:hypothetical protein [Gammaproteobacteria bacterium]
MNALYLPIHPYIGAGLTSVYAEVKNKSSGVTTSKDDDSGTDAWLGAGKGLEYILKQVGCCLLFIHRLICVKNIK